ncbi:MULTISPECIES: inner membrane protein YhjD [unclassified Crossiella]|uniref:inner membrane protein YhjD n=1 Tax=unclassified Crossiella TaxID=2620835 RepID=UPI001FFE92E4|nr:MULTISPECIES: inner membrane protein YhjD [unclassified Crossiella]MCK2238290.1 inner membrane protein YhjD [Crossiella sp. S99.2]MCK2256330.1 inner membrane protein YhjD [Crossiella sp. S99.1]
MSTEKPSWFARQRERFPWLDHLVRAGGRYQERYGDHYAAAITYFSVLSLVPVLMVAFAAAGLVLSGNTELLDQAKAELAAAVPDKALSDTLTRAVQQAIDQRYAVGIIGLAVALYSGVGWMTNLRDAITAQWGQAREELPLLRTYLVDFLSLIGLGLALVVSFGLTTLAQGFAEDLLDLVGLHNQGLPRVLFLGLAVLLSVVANFGVFLWVLAWLPRKRVSARSALKGALAAAIGFELLKQVGGIYLRSISASPAGAAFGSLLGLLVFIYLVSRFLLFVTAWTATARDNLAAEPIQPPPPAVIRPVVEVRGGPAPRQTAALLGIGAAVGLLLRGLFRSRRD